MKILDCTLRDGGYYSGWDFDENISNSYIESFNNLPVDYLEIGYRSMPLPGYYGKFYYCPVYVMEELREKSNKKRPRMEKCLNDLVFLKIAEVCDKGL